MFLRVCGSLCNNYKFISEMQNQESQITDFLSSLVEGKELAVDRMGFITTMIQYKSQLELVSKGNLTLDDLQITKQRTESSRFSVIQSRTVIDTGFWGMILQGDVDIPNGSIVKLKLNGMMFMNGFTFAMGMAQFADVLAALNHHDIKGILIECDTLGGTDIAANRLYTAIKDSDHKVITWAHYCLSGGIWGTCGSDEIYASGLNSKFGSIGVYTTLWKPLMEYLKENYVDVYSTGSVGKNSEYREWEEKGTFDGYLKRVDASHEMFKEIVSENRILLGDEKTIQDTVSGYVYNARDAKARGLIDGIATYKEVLEKF